MYKNKYLKYKQKYLNLKSNMNGGLYVPSSSSSSSHSHHKSKKTKEKEKIAKTHEYLREVINYINYNHNPNNNGKINHYHDVSDFCPFKQLTCDEGFIIYGNLILNNLDKNNETWDNFTQNTITKEMTNGKNYKYVFIIENKNITSIDADAFLNHPLKTVYIRNCNNLNLDNIGNRAFKPSNIEDLKYIELPLIHDYNNIINQYNQLVNLHKNYYNMMKINKEVKPHAAFLDNEDIESKAIDAKIRAILGLNDIDNINSDEIYSRKNIITGDMMWKTEYTKF